jgi:hypothetical protein
VAAKNESTLTRSAKGEWTWVKGGETINQPNLQSLLNTLSSLHAVRWIGPTLPQHGLEKPQLTITFTTSPDDKSFHKLSIGSAAGDGNWFGRVDEREGTFVISNADFDALHLPLAIAPGSPSPTATGATASPSPLPSATQNP